MDRHQPLRLHAFGEGPQIDGRSMPNGVKMGGLRAAILEPSVNQSTVIILVVAKPHSPSKASTPGCSAMPP